MMKKMKENVLPFPAHINQTIYSDKTDERRRILWTTTVSFSAFAGFLLFAAGFIVSLLAYLETGVYQSANSRLGGYLLLTAFPMFLLAAHALDKSAFYKRREKINSRARHRNLLNEFK